MYCDKQPVSIWAKKKRGHLELICPSQLNSTSGVFTCSLALYSIRDTVGNRIDALQYALPIVLLDYSLQVPTRADVSR